MRSGSGTDWGRTRGGGPGTVQGARGGGRSSSGLMRDCRNPGMESWRFAGGTTGCRSAGDFLMTEHTQTRAHFEGCFHDGSRGNTIKALAPLDELIMTFMK